MRDRSIATGSETASPVRRTEGLAAYRRGRPPQPVDLRLDGNEGLHPPAELWARVADRAAELCRGYPSTEALEARLRRHIGVASAEIVVTAGADEALDRVCRAFLDESRNAVVATPTFEMLPRYAKLASTELRTTPWLDGRLPCDELLALVDDHTAAVFVVTPNNPTGLACTVADVVRLARASPHAWIVVDHAYAEFADVDLTRDVLVEPNVVVVRTLSKAWGLAGLRTGYAIGPAAFVDALRRAGSPYSVSSPSVALACAWLDEGGDDVARYCTRVRDERGELSAILRGLGLVVPESQANFVMARGTTARWLRDGLLGLGIAVRGFDGELRDAVRATLPGDADRFARLRAGVEACLSPAVVLHDADGGELATRLGACLGARAATRRTIALRREERDEVFRALARSRRERAWYVGSEPAALAQARAAGAVPIAVPGVADDAALLAAGAARVLTRSEDLEELP